MAQCTDIAIQTTCDDASMCKKYAVLKGYWKDPFVTDMVHGTGQRKQPEISRGYYARTEGIWQLLQKFITINQQNCQIVSLGAGLDTTYWRLASEGCQPKRYVEVDFPDVIRRKIYCIGHKTSLHSTLQDFSLQKDTTCLHCGPYHLINADLRNLTELEGNLHKCDLNFNLPTLFLTECVLIYMPPENSQAIMHWVAEKFSDAVFVNYEQLHMDDSFGQVMISNLKARQCWLAGATACTSLEAHEERFLKSGWKQVSCKDMWMIYNSLPDRRVYRLFLVDAIKDMLMIQSLAFRRYFLLGPEPRLALGDLAIPGATYLDKQKGQLEYAL